MRWFLILLLPHFVYAQQTLFLNEQSDATDIKKAWKINTNIDKKYRAIYRDPTWYLSNDENLQHAPRTAVKIHFQHNSFTILAASYPILAEHAKVLQEHPNAVVVIAGHTDNRGSALYNLGLSYKRAEAVQQFLIQQHMISATQLRIKPYGEMQPIASNDSESGRLLNRRVEFLYLGEL